MKGIILFVKKYYSIILFYGICISLGLFSVYSYSTSYDKNVSRLSNAESEQNITVKVTGYPKISSSRLSVCSEAISDGKLVKYGSGIYVTVTDIPKECISPGDILRFSADVQTYSNASNEGGYSFASYLKEKNMCATCKIKFKDLSIIRVKGSAARKIYEIRRSFTRICDTYLADENCSGLVKAVISGDRSGLNDDTSEAFKRCGIYHIVAISGLHLSIIASILLSLFSRLKFRKQKKNIFTYSAITAASFFVLLFTGCGVSVIRAAFMLGIVALCVIFSRAYSGKHSLFLAAFFISVFFPQDLFGVSFYLSFLSTLAVMCSVDVIKFIKNNTKFGTAANKSLFSVAVVSVMSTMFTLPVTAFSFGYIPLLSFAANAIVLPIIPFLIGMSVIFSLTCIFPFRPLTLICSYAVNSLAEAVIIPAKIISSLSFSSIEVIPDILAAFFFSLAAFVFCILILKRYGAIKFIAVMSIFTIAGISFLRYNNGNDKIKVTYFDVGQGDCSIITMPNGETAMIDCGTQYSSSAKQTASNVTAYMRINGLTAISTAYVTHLHNDHTNALRTLIENGRIKRLVLPQYSDLSENEAKTIKKELLCSAAKAHIPIYYASDKTKIKYKNGTEFKIYFPEKDKLYDNNNMSAAIKITYGKSKFFFCGDSEEKEQKILVGKDIECSVLKVAHHGGYSKMSDSLIKKCNPQYAVVSCGKNNMYNHPSRKTVNALVNNNVRILRTDISGAVSVYADKGGIEKITVMKK